MSHKSGRKSSSAALAEEKEKKTDNPLKEMKKKIAANAEREKQATDKTAITPERSNKNTDKVTEKPQNEKTDKKAHAADKDKTPTDKNAQKHEKIAEKEKNVDKDKVADKKVDKPVEKKNEPEKKEEAKTDGKDKAEKPKQNGGTHEANGADTVSEPDSSGEEQLVIDDQDELFPELVYELDDASDAEGEEGAPSRSFTRRSQVKATKTPETPRPASFKEDDSKEKPKTNDSLATDRKLRSADSPKPESKKAEPKKAQDSPKKDKTIDLTEDEPEKTADADKSKEDSEKNKRGGEKNEEVNEKTKEGAEKTNEGAKKTALGKSQLETDVGNDMENTEEARARARARVAPYSRAGDSPSSLAANYTGNNTTMEMDITETSALEEGPPEESSYLRALRSVRARGSYRPLAELSLKHALDRSARSNASLNESLRPTGTVVGRKRRPDADEVEPEEAPPAAPGPAPGPAPALHAHCKRMRLLDRFAVPFRGFNTRQPEIVGINTDLPLTAPVASTSTFDPETLKASPTDPVAMPLPTPAQDRDSKRCLIM